MPLSALLAWLLAAPVRAEVPPVAVLAVTCPTRNSAYCYHLVSFADSYSVTAEGAPVYQGRREVRVLVDTLGLRSPLTPRNMLLQPWKAEGSYIHISGYAEPSTDVRAALAPYLNPPESARSVLPARLRDALWNEVAQPCLDRGEACWTMRMLAADMMFER